MPPASLFGCKDVLCFLGSANRACLSTSTARDALVCVDIILAVAFCNCIHGASLNTCTASYAIIGNLECHFQYLLINYLTTYIVSYFFCFATCFLKFPKKIMQKRLKILQHMEAMEKYRRISLAFRFFWNHLRSFRAAIPSNDRDDIAWEEHREYPLRRHGRFLPGD